MKKLYFLFLISILSIPFVAKSQISGGDRILGTYLTADKKAKVEIYKCNGDEYCGKIIWLKEPTRDGKIKRDNRNPDPKLRDRKIEGLTMLSGFEFNPEDKLWDEGEIYDPQSGKTYDAYMVFEDDNVLKLKGYIGFTWIGRSTYWTKIR